jgi:uncharacterized iron-regulated protein
MSFLMRSAAPKLALAFLFFLLDGTARADLPAGGAKLNALLRQLEKEIAAVRGLAFKSPVAAQIIPRPKDTPVKQQGYYSPRDKTLFVYDDVAGNYERGVLVHEMVHALQDQHFGLAKLHQRTFGSDAELALAALVEGDATFTMIELLKKDQPRVTAMLDVPLEKARDLQNAFLYGQGARYVKALKERGGWEAVNARYKFPPEATADILHPDGVAAIDLGPGTTRGEFGIIALLSESPETKAQAVQAAAGWRGDREFDAAGGKAWVVAFATSADALRFQAALAKQQAARHPDYKSVTAEPGGDVRRSDKSATLAVLARGERVLALEAPGEAAYRTLLDAVEGPPALTIYSAREKTALSFGELIDRLLGADLVCVGETHDSDLDHRVQLQIIKGLFARDERLGVGMEMFQRPYQKPIDRYFLSEITEEEFLKATEYRQRWGFEWSLYRPIVEFCRRNGVPLAALNAPRELTRRISKVGFAALTDDEKKQLGPIDFHVKEHREYWYDRLAKMHGNDKATPEQKEHGYQVMAVWDQYMATSAVEFQRQRKLRRLVVLAGSGHVERGLGIPARALAQGAGKVATVRVEVGAKLEAVMADPRADFVVIVR